MTVLQLQCLLLYLGYSPGEIDGKDGPKTRRAVTAFLKSRGLQTDGISGEETARALCQAVAEDTGEHPAESGGFWESIRFFRREEFRCNCGGRFCNGFPAEPKEKLVRLADALRQELGVPLYVSSGVRCPTHNKNVGGVANSRHLQGRAMDFCARGMDSGTLLARVQALPGISYAYAIDNRFVHMDVT